MHICSSLVAAVNERARGNTRSEPRPSMRLGRAGAAHSRSSRRRRTRLDRIPHRSGRFYLCAGSNLRCRQTCATSRGAGGDGAVGAASFQPGECEDVADSPRRAAASLLLVSSCAGAWQHRSGAGGVGVREGSGGRGQGFAEWQDTEIRRRGVSRLASWPPASSGGLPAGGNSICSPRCLRLLTGSTALEPPNRPTAPGR